MNISLEDAEVTKTQPKPTQKLSKKTMHYAGDGIAVLQVDNSSLSNHVQCATKYFYNSIKKRCRDNQTALTYGSGIHEALEYYYTVKAKGEPFESRTMMQKALVPFDGSSVPVGEWRTPELCMDTLKKYVTHYHSKDEFTIVDLDDGPAVEQSFSLPLGEIPFEDDIDISLFSNPEEIITQHPDHKPTDTLYIDTVQIFWIGKIDMVVDYNGNKFVFDHKTTSRLGYSFWGQFPTSRQMQGYTWAVGEILGELPKGVEINCIAGRKPTKTGTGTEFARQKFYYTPETIEEWKQNTLELCSDLLYNFRRGKFPMNTDQCMAKYGTCPYLDCCSLPPKQREMFLATDHYTDNTWSPLD